MVDFQSRDRPSVPMSDDGDDGDESADDDGEATHDDDEAAAEASDAAESRESVAAPDESDGDSGAAADESDSADATGATHEGPESSDAGVESGEDPLSAGGSAGETDGSTAETDSSAGETGGSTAETGPLTPDGSAVETEPTDGASHQRETGEETGGETSEREGAAHDPEDVEEAIAAKERQRADGDRAGTESDSTATAAATETGGENTGESAGDAQRTVNTAVVTVSPDRTHDDDPAGDAIESVLEAEGHDVVTRELLRPTYDTVQQTLAALVSRDDVDAVIANGGTGVTDDDVTVEAVHPLIEKALPGFGEVFRSHYYKKVGADVVESRAMAGIADSTPIFCLPGDPAAVSLGVGGIVVDQAPRIVAALEAEGPADR